jgi:hypothetical protein
MIVVLNKIRDAGNFITHLKTRFRDNSENGLNDTINQMKNAFEEDPFIMVGLISAVGDDQSSTDSDQSSTDSDQSSTHGPNDREDQNRNTKGKGKGKGKGWSKIKDWLSTIIALLNWSGDGGGGDSSPWIPNLGKWWVLNSFISGWIKLYSYFDSMPGWLRYALIGCLTAYYLYIKISWASMVYQFDMRWMLPSFTRFRLPYNGSEGIPVQPLTAWTNPPHYNNWIIALQNSYGINHLKGIRRSLGLRFIRGHAISVSYLAKAFADRGLRTCIVRDIVSALVRVSTRTYDPISNKYLLYYFHILVYMGIGVVVWYQIIPSAGELVAPCPTGFDTDILPAFQDPSSIVEGYRKVSYLITRDITPTVIHAYKNEFIFRDLLNIDLQEDVFQSLEGRHSLVCLGTALMMAVFITTKTIALPA